MLPRFKPQQVSEHDGKIEVVGSVSSDNFRGQVWLGAKWIGYIGRVGEAPIEGRWFPVGSQWKFVSEDRQALAFKKEEELCLYDGYWGERALIVLAPLSWKKEEFVPTKQWDHEHCGICWATIAASTSMTSFLSSERDIVCPDCYQKYVTARSLAFIEEGPIQPPQTTPGSSAPLRV
ncbi:MAG: hypothetical protein KDK74_01250 [Cephaloticoccus sp.]|nr:hypothetical protein [Cephaloticoccus sp.]